MMNPQLASLSPIANLLSKAGDERRQQQQQADLAGLLGQARGGDSAALNQLLTQNTQLGGLALQEQQAQQAAMQKQQDEQEALYLSSLLGTEDPQRQQAIIQEGFNAGVFDQEDIQAFSSMNMNELKKSLADELKVNGFEYLLPNSMRGDIKSPTTNKTIVYKNGTYQAIMNDGSRRVFNAQDNLLQGEDAQRAIKSGVNSGIQFEGDKAAEVTSRQEQAKTNTKDRNEYIRLGRVAKEMMPKTEDLLRLNELIESGGFAANAKAVADWLGVANADQGLFNAKAGKLILDNIRALGANPTEGERAFLEKITPSIRQGKAVNKAILEDMYEVQKRQVERARWLADNPDSTVDDYFFMEGVDDFSTSNRNYETPQAESQSSGSLSLRKQLEIEKAKLNGQSATTTNSGTSGRGR